MGHQNRRRIIPTVGSNPTVSAIFKGKADQEIGWSFLLHAEIANSLKFLLEAGYEWGLVYLNEIPVDNQILIFLHNLIHLHYEQTLQL